jgi:hypothetical protein
MQSRLPVFTRPNPGIDVPIQENLVPGVDQPTTDHLGRHDIRSGVTDENPGH